MFSTLELFFDELFHQLEIALFDKEEKNLLNNHCQQPLNLTCLQHLLKNTELNKPKISQQKKKKTKSTATKCDFKSSTNINKIPPNKIHPTKDRCHRNQGTKPTKKHRT
jgi:hypothetical protein